jgi:hypothetical protein
MKINRSDFKQYGVTSNIYSSNFFTQPEMSDDGFLKVDTILARQCVLPYTYQDPKGGAITQGEFIGNAIYADDFLSSGEGLPFVLEHPQDSAGNFVGVSPDNYQELVKGVVTNPRIVSHDGEDIVIGTLKVWDKEVIDLILKKKLKEVSQGYFCTTQKRKGEYNNVSYDAEQENIILNHLALVAEGRAGDTVRLLYNKKPDEELLAFVQNSKSGEKTMSKPNHVNTGDNPADDKDLIPNQDPATGGTNIVDVLMKIIQMLMGSGMTPAPAANAFPPEDDKLMGNSAALQLIANALKTQPAQNPVNGGDYLTVDTAKKIAANSARDFEKAILLGKAIIGPDAHDEILKHNSVSDFQRAVLVTNGKNEDEVKAMSPIQVSAHFEALAEVKKNEIIQPKHNSGEPYVTGNPDQGIEYVTD